MNQKNLFKGKENGITLIALVITIIVLLILAGIVISMLSGENGILNQAANAKTRTEEELELERVKLAVGSALTAGKGEIDLAEGSTKENSLEKALNEEFKNDSKKPTYEEGKITLSNGEIYSVTTSGSMEKESGEGEAGGESTEVVTSYTQEDIDNSDGKLVPIGATEPLHVVAAFNDDFSSVIITKNGVNSDGLMMNWTSDNYKTTNSMYLNSSTLTSLTIKNGVTSIGDYAFRECTGFTGTLTIPDSVTSIGKFAFYGCSEFTGNLTIPDGVTSIRRSTFSGCSGFTGDLVIPDGVTSIEQYAFNRCEGFTGTLTIGDNVTSIGKYAFNDCTGITEVTIPDSVTSVDTMVFTDCTGITKITLSSSMTDLGNSMFNCCTGITEVTIPDGVTSVGGSIFYGCTGITEVTIPNSVTTLGHAAFYLCSGLTKITFKGTVEEWNAITFDSSWSGHTGEYTVYCTNGNVAKNTPY